MADALRQALPFALAVAVSPFPVIGVVLILATPAGRVNGLAFLLGAVAGVGVAGGALLLVIGGGEPGTTADPATWVSVAKLALAAVLVRVAAQQWRARPAPGEAPPLPSWMSAVEALTAPRAAGMGVLLAALNPKNLILVAAGAAAIAESDASGADQAAALAVFTAVACAGTAVPVAMSLLMGERARRLLQRLREWLVRSSAAIVAVVSLLIAAKLLADAVAGLAA